jgi:glycerate 2-kinase
VTGPIGEPVESHFGLFKKDGKTIGVLDMAAAAGLRLVPTDSRDPTVTTTYGVGELMVAALDEGCSKIIIGCGDSGTSDGGAGLLQALGVRFLDVNGNDIPQASGGNVLGNIASVNLDNIHPRLKDGSGWSSLVPAQDEH